MKKIIKIGLLATAAFLHVTFAAAPQEDLNGCVEGVVVGESGEVVAGVENSALTEALHMWEAVRDGCVPTEILDLFSDIPKIDVSQRASPAIIQSMSTALREALLSKLDEDGLWRLNVLLKVLVTPAVASSSIIPLAQEFFGLMDEDLTGAAFFTHLTRAYNRLFGDASEMILAHINMPADWVVLQFLGLFFDNAISNLRFNVNAAGLGSVDLVKDVVSGLDEAATLNLMKINNFQNAQQVEILQEVAECRSKKLHIIAAVESVADIESFLNSVTDPSLHTFTEGSKIDISLIVNFQHRELHDRIASLIGMFDRISDRSMPYVWDLMLKLKSFENVAYGDLTPVIRAVVRSPIGENLSLPTLISDHPTTVHVMTRLKNEFLSPESKVRQLDFEGSQLSDEGWEQLALLAEANKPFKKIRLTGMQISPTVAGRLGRLRVEGINMVGCGVKAADLTDMIAGWLGEGSTLRGVDMCGNEVNEIVATLFIEKGFEIYFQDRIQPQGYIFAKY